MERNQILRSIAFVKTFPLDFIRFLEFFNYLLFYFREKKKAHTLFRLLNFLSLCKQCQLLLPIRFHIQIYESFQNSFKFHIHLKFCCIGVKFILVGSNNKHRRKQTKSFLLHSFLTSRAKCSEITRLNVKPVLHILFLSFINYYNKLAYTCTHTHSITSAFIYFQSQFHQHHKIIEIN